ncbi:hypothetical protein B0T18DRAFT_97682 [Schizothecium vesticola]|uniref:Uncharacterized protein n=1 Tax=Schizothecium vesticola TaxID=314040 RepID=A0AA40F0S9_9PEZI|nr:hypothetical protein B0T18DRAFT_97682 [Schizothecium vesticola]
MAGKDMFGRRAARWPQVWLGEGMPAPFVCAIAEQSSNGPRHCARTGNWRWFQLRGDQILLLEPGSFIPQAQCPVAVVSASPRGPEWKALEVRPLGGDASGRRCKWLTNGEAAIQRLTCRAWMEKGEFVHRSTRLKGKD